MRLNGVKVTVYNDKLGPFDAYYLHGSILSELPPKKVVRRAFDYDGSHIGICSHYLGIKQKLLYILTLCILLCIIAVPHIFTTTVIDCIVYQEDTPYVVDDNVILNIKNINDDTLYIFVNEVEYEIIPGDTLKSVPYFASEFTLTYKYKGASTEREINL